MAGASFRLDAELLGADRVGSMMARLLDRMGDLTRPMDQIGAALEDSTHQRFVDETGPDGVKWKPSLRARKDGGKTLTDSRRLENSTTHLAERLSVEIGSNMIYAGIHQFGGTITKYAASMPIHRRQSDIRAGGPARFVKRGKSDFMTYHEVGQHDVVIPVRPFLGVDHNDELTIDDVLFDWLNGAFA